MTASCFKLVRKFLLEKVFGSTGILPVRRTG
jgi:hypothetical protein